MLKRYYFPSQNLNSPNMFHHDAFVPCDHGEVYKDMVRQDGSEITRVFCAEP